MEQDMRGNPHSNIPHLPLAPAHEPDLKRGRHAVEKPHSGRGIPAREPGGVVRAARPYKSLALGEAAAPAPAALQGSGLVKVGRS